MEKRKQEEEERVTVKLEVKKLSFCKLAFSKTTLSFFRKEKQDKNVADPEVNGNTVEIKF